MRLRFASAVGVAVLLLTGLTACGDEGGIGGDRKAFIDAIDPMCEKAVQEADQIGDATDAPTLEKAFAVWNELYQGVKARPIPSEDFDGGQKFVAGITNISLAASDAYQSALINDNAAVSRALNTQDLAKKSTSETADAYGFEDGCNQLDTAGENDSDEDNEDDN